MSNKTRPTAVNPYEFLDQLEDTQQREDCKKLLTIMEQVSGQPAVMWGPSIVGFGTYHYKYASGREDDWMKIGFSPRKGKISLYITGDASKYASELHAMGKHEVGKGCIYIKKLADVDEKRLAEIIKTAYNNDTY